MSDDFKWDDVEDDLIQDDQLAVAVYHNPEGNIVIRQKADGYLNQDDAVVVVAKEKLAGLIAKLQHCLEGND